MSAPFKCPKCGHDCEQQYCPVCDSQFDSEGLIDFDDTLVDIEENEAVGQDVAAPNDALPTDDDEDATE